jgi:hypothetical protein
MYVKTFLSERAVVLAFSHLRAAPAERQAVRFRLKQSTISFHHAHGSVFKLAV